MIPGKTFLLGEYIAMYGGPALIALTQPCFQLDMNKRLHPDCPAARLWKHTTGNSCDWGLNDPYQSKGGLGASSAEFLLAYKQLYPGKIDIPLLHKTFLAYSSKNQGMAPSGYDLVAQTSNGCVLVESNPIHMQSFDWQFKEIGFVLVHTGIKLPTHSHLKDLQDLNWQAFIPAAEKACEAMMDSNTEDFLSAINNFSAQLRKQHLLASHTKHLLENWTQQLPILAAKGCGAMGADVIAIFALEDKIDFIVSFLNQKMYDVLATHHDLYLENAKK